MDKPSDTLARLTNPEWVPKVSYEVYYHKSNESDLKPYTYVGSFDTLKDAQSLVKRMSDLPDLEFIIETQHNR